ncbi:MAG: hypothetical protein ACJA06_001735 [Halocynthiibacter sp.]|jgi:hypothetical protein
MPLVQYFLPDLMRRKERGARAIARPEIDQIFHLAKWKDVSANLLLGEI